MQLEESKLRRAEAVTEFQQAQRRDDAADVINSLTYGLTVLRNLFFTRVHDDVEMEFGVDSMLLPVSGKKGEAKTKSEIEVYQIAVSAEEVNNRSFVDGDDGWFANWLAKLRLGDELTETHLGERLANYLNLEKDAKRLEFSRVLQKTLPETVKAPLILFRLFPLAVQIATAVAFGDHFAATELRQQQSRWQPAIADCLECHGRVLDNGERCRTCANPLWEYVWLEAAD